MTASVYDLFAADTQAERCHALATLLPRLNPDHGPILDIGAGTGLNAVVVLEQMPSAEVFAIEPSRTMRAIMMSKIASRPEWFDRVTIRPEDFFSASLPDRLSGAILWGVLGHFDPGERGAVLAELAARLPAGGAAVLDLPSPQHPARIEPYEITGPTIGELTYRTIVEAWPLGAERMQWRTTFLALEDERIVIEDTTEHEYRHPAADLVARQAAEVGLRLERVDRSSCWMLIRD